MSIQQFNSRNNINDVITFQKSGSTSSFDPTITYSSGSKRVSWRINNGSGTTQTAGNSITYTGFTSDTSIRTIEMRGSDFKNIMNFELNNDNLYGSLNLTKIKNLNYFNVAQNSKLTGVTHGASDGNFIVYNALLCDITGNHNLSMFPNLGGNFGMAFNSKLTGVTHTASSKVFNNYNLTACNIIGNHNVSMLTNLGGTFTMFLNPNLTGVTHTTSTQIMSQYDLTSCNITGNHNMSMFPNLGGSFTMNSNINLTGITHTASTQVFTSYSVGSCNITGNHNLSMFPNLGGSLFFSQNASLTGITHTASTINVTDYNAASCNLIGTLDISMLNLGVTGSTKGYVTLQSNPNLTNVLFPTVSNKFRNNLNSSSNYAFVLKQCNFDYIDFKPLSGSTLLSGATIGLPAIELQDNTMGAGDVNHILDDFKNMATNNPSGWSNIRLFIGGTNTDPDSSSGGYDGLAAIATLTGSPYNWTITY